MSRWNAFRWALAAVLAATAVAAPAEAVSPAQARANAQDDISAAESGIGRARARAARLRVPAVTPEKRIAEGDLLLRAKDYERAIHVLSQVIELHRQGQVPPAAHADALLLLGEGYFADGQFLSSRREYRELLDHGSQSAYTPYAGRALSRLVDVALQTGNPQDLDEVFTRMQSLPSTDASGSLQYARGKAFFARGQFAEARAALDRVPGESSFQHQAQYLLGVVLTREGAPARPSADAASPANAAQPSTESPPEPTPRARYAPAIEQFRRVTRLPADTTAERHVVDLSWMAIGRLFYESDNYLDAAEAYSHVDRKSPEFSTMLYELGWVYVRLGDFQRAQRALEVLAITDPESLEVADGSLLRADLMLRSGQFEKALKVYQGVRRRFDPIRSEVEEFLRATTDPAVYYDELLADGVETTGRRTPLPPIVLEWTRAASEDDRLFAVVDDVNRSRELIQDSRVLALKLNAVLGSPTRVKAFPELLASLQELTALLNQLGRARYSLALGMDEVAGRQVADPELAAVRRERQALMGRLRQVPIEQADFANREVAGTQQWRDMSQQLQRLSVQTDKLQALVNGLKRVLRDADQFGVARDQASRERFAAEIAANERDIETYRQQLQRYQEAVEMGRVQIGFGDQRFIDDARVRERFRVLFRQEVSLVLQGRDVDRARQYAASIGSLLERADSADARLEPLRQQLEAQAGDQARALSQVVAEESANLEKYTYHLDELDQEARLLVGEVAMRNFASVRDRLKSIVLRADVGIVQEAWEVREAQRSRVIRLQRERSLEDRQLSDELREVLDDAEDAP